jgi:hypothetical protein
MIARFDPTRAIVFDFARGRMRDDEGETRLNLPASAIVRLLASAGDEGGRAFAAELGLEIGRRVLGRLKTELSEAPVETWADHLGGQLALIGLGDLSVERWGRALVFRVRGIPRDLEGLVGVLLEAAIHRVLGREVRLPGFPDGSDAAFLAVSPVTAERVYQLAAGGAGLAQTVESLHAMEKRA